MKEWEVTDAYGEVVFRGCYADAKRALAEEKNKRPVSPFTRLPFVEYAEKVLKIAPKAGSIVPFVLNRAQLRVEEIIAECDREQRPVRILILKARQLGFSTWGLARQYHYCTTHEGVTGLMAAHEAEATEVLFQRVKLMHDENPHKPMTKFSTKKMLDFQNSGKGKDKKNADPGLRSKIVVATAGRESLGRSQTLQVFHGSECAFWPNAKETLLSVEQAIANLPGTIEILESTANGIGGEFYERWQMVTHPAYRGDWRAVFFPWFDDPDCRLKIGAGVMPIPPCIARTEEFLAEEQDLKVRYKLDDEQLNWRRWAIVNLCGNDMSKFRQEYPSNPHEAFLSSGRPIFNQDILRARDRALRAVDLERAEKGEAPRFVTMNVAESSGKPVFKPSPSGLWRIYKWPETGREYLVGIDPCKGQVKGKNPDSACIQVIDRHTWEQVAVYHDRSEAMETARQAELIGYLYNTALLIPEANDHGHTVCVRLQGTMYPNLYMRQDQDAIGMGVLERPGYYMDVKTRPLVIDAIDEGINSRNLVINDLETIAELLTFVRHPRSGKAEADEGCHDDRVIALGIPLAVIELMHQASSPRSERARDGLTVEQDALRRFKDRVVAEYLQGQGAA